MAVYEAYYFSLYKEASHPRSGLKNPTSHQAATSTSYICSGDMQCIHSSAALGSSSFDTLEESDYDGPRSNTHNIDTLDTQTHTGTGTHLDVACTAAAAIVDATRLLIIATFAGRGGHYDGSGVRVQSTPGNDGRSLIILARRSLLIVRTTTTTTTTK